MLKLSVPVRALQAAKDKRENALKDIQATELLNVEMSGNKKPASDATVSASMSHSKPELALLTKDNLPEVGMALDIYFLSVDDAKEEFIIDLKIHTIYKDPKFLSVDSGSADIFERVQKYPGFIPKLQVDNIGTARDTFFVSTSVNKHNGLVWTSFKNTFTVSQYMQLKRFPFDRQIFFVNVGVVNAQLRPWFYDTAILNFSQDTSGDKNAVLTDDDTEAVQRVTGAPKGWNVPIIKGFYVNQQGSTIGMELLGTAILAERVPWFYGFNFTIVIFFIVATNICLLSISPEEAADRNSLTLTLLLTLVAFKFVLMQGVPKLTYMTYMDKYVMLGFLFIMIAIAENAILVIDSLAEVVDPVEFDIIFQGVYIVSWVLVHVIIVFCMLFPNVLRTGWADVLTSLDEETYRTVVRTKTVHDITNTPDMGLK